MTAALMMLFSASLDKIEIIQVRLAGDQDAEGSVETPQRVPCFVGPVAGV